MCIRDSFWIHVFHDVEVWEEYNVFFVTVHELEATNNGSGQCLSLVNIIATDISTPTLWLLVSTLSNTALCYNKLLGHYSVKSVV